MKKNIFRICGLLLCANLFFGCGADGTGGTVATNDKGGRDDPYSVNEEIAIDNITRKDTEEKYSLNYKVIEAYSEGDCEDMYYDEYPVAKVMFRIEGGDKNNTINYGDVFKSSPMTEGMEAENYCPVSTKTLDDLWEIYTDTDYETYLLGEKGQEYKYVVIQYKDKDGKEKNIFVGLDDEKTDLTDNTEEKDQEGDNQKKFEEAKGLLEKNEYEEAYKILSKIVGKDEEIGDYWSYACGMIYKENMYYGQAIERLINSDGVLDADEQIKEIKKIVEPYVGTYKGDLGNYKGVQGVLCITEDGKVFWDYASGFDMNQKQYYLLYFSNYTLQDNSNEIGNAFDNTVYIDDVIENGNTYESHEAWFRKKDNDILVCSIDNDAGYYTGSYEKISDEVPDEKE